MEQQCPPASVLQMGQNRTQLLSSLNPSGQSKVRKALLYLPTMRRSGCCLLELHQQLFFVSLLPFCPLSPALAHLLSFT